MSSRNEFALLNRLGSEERPLTLPPFAAWEAPMDYWVSEGVSEVQVPGAGPSAIVPAPSVAVVVGSVSVSNIRWATQREGDVRVDRTSGSVLGNPFRMHATPAAHRVAVCEAAAELIRGVRAFAPTAVADVAAERCLECAEGLDEPGLQEARREAVESLAIRLAAGHDLRLLCWCAPARCHADDIAHVVRARASAIHRAAAGKRRR